MFNHQTVEPIETAAQIHRRGGHQHPCRSRHVQGGSGSGSHRQAVGRRFQGRAERRDREVPVEVLVNGQPVARKTIVADGQVRNLSFDVDIDRSSWVALRILPSSHTNPIWVLVGDKPLSPSRRSAEWCLKGVDQCWSQKQRFIKADELEGAKQDYEHARESYRQRMAECQAD